MRASKLFFPTLREIPGEAELIRHKLLLRAGTILRLTQGMVEVRRRGARERSEENVDVVRDRVATLRDGGRHGTC